MLLKRSVALLFAVVVLLLVYIFPSPAAAVQNFYRVFISAGDVPGGMAADKCSSLGTRDGLGVINLSTGLQFWWYDASATTAADATHVHCSDTSWTSGVWERVEVDPLMKWNTSEPSSLDIGQFYGADGATWDPTNTSQTGNHVVLYSDVATWLLVRSDDGTWYFDNIWAPVQLSCFTHHAGADDPYNDTATPHVLLASEVFGSVITNAGAAQDRVYTLPAGAHGFNFKVMVVAAYQMDLEPNGSETLWLNGLQMAGGEHIVNSADTKGDFMDCWSVETGDGTYETFCYSENANWAQATPP